MNQINQQITEKINGAEETKRQLFFMDKAKGYVEALAGELGRKPTCCVTTFGCQVNTEHETRKATI